MKIDVRNNNVDQALRVLKKKLQQDGFFNELRQREFYESKGTKKRREKNAAIRRYRREEEKRREEGKRKRRNKDRNKHEPTKPTKTTQPSLDRSKAAQLFGIWVSFMLIRGASDLPLPVGSCSRCTANDHCGARRCFAKQR